MALEQTAAQIQQLNASIHRLQQTVEHHRMLRDQAQHYANVLQNWVLSYNANHSNAPATWINVIRAQNTVREQHGYVQNYQYQLLLLERQRYQLQTHLQREQGRVDQQRRAQQHR